MVECTALEMRRTCKGIVGSNPTLSAIASEGDNVINHLWRELANRLSRVAKFCSSFGLGIA